MRAIIVDDESLMIRAFMRMTEDIRDLNVEGTFENAEDASACTETEKGNPCSDVRSVYCYKKWHTGSSERKSQGDTGPYYGKKRQRDQQ